MIALLVTAATLTLVGAIVISLERHRKLTPITAVVTGLGTLAIVLGAITVTFAVEQPALADIPPRGFIDNLQPDRVVDVDLPTL